MVEYAKCIYKSWAEQHDAAYVLLNKHEFIAICSRLLKYEPAELEQRLNLEHWYKD